MPWTWSLNWGEITPTIVIGTCPMAPSDLRRIREGTGATAVLSLQHDDCLVYWSIDYDAMCRAGAELELRMARCPIQDFNIADMRRQLPAAVAALARLQEQGDRTYVHCTAGLGRAPLTVLAYLTLVQRLDPEEAIQLILQGRPGAVPAWEAYHGCLEDLADRHRSAIKRRAYELYKRGANDTAAADWDQAQSEVIRSALLSA